MDKSTAREVSSVLFGRGRRVCGVVDSGSLHEVLALWVLHVVDCVEWGYSWQHH